MDSVCMNHHAFLTKIDMEYQSMKKILLAFSLCTLPLLAELGEPQSAGNQGNHSGGQHANNHGTHSRVSLENRAENLSKHIDKLKEEAKGDLSKVWSALNSYKEEGNVGPKRTNYVVCYGKEGDKYTNFVHPRKKHRGEVTKKEIVDMLPAFFDAAGKGVHSYEYKGKKKNALVMAVSSDKDDYKDKQFVCAVTEKHK